MSKRPSTSSKNTFSRALSPFLFSLLACHVPLVSVSAAPILWSSTGGGWRSMAAVMGFANLFQQAELFLDATSSSSSGGAPNNYIASVATGSGSTWFSTQFFYSQAFNNITMSGSPQELYDFVFNWMNAYRMLSQNIVANSSSWSCPLPNFPSMPGDEVNLIAEAEQYCLLFHHYHGDWATFVKDMLETVSTNVYNDAGFATRLLTRDNRVARLQTTHLLMQTALSPTFRLPTNGTDTIFLVGPPPNDGDVEADVTSLEVPVYTTFLPVVFTVDNFSEYSQSYFDYGGGNHSDGNFQIYNGPFAPKIFSFNDFPAYGLYPGTDGSLLVDAKADIWHFGNVTSSNDTYSRSLMSPPFAGQTPTTVQLAAISSAAVGGLSPLIPSALAQVGSLMRYQYANKSLQLQALDAGFKVLYDTPLFFDISVCSQWPNDCGETDARFVDSYFVDNPTLALNVAHQQKTMGAGDLARQPALKVIVTDTNVLSTGNIISLSDSSLLSYFSTDWNQGVTPGGFNWAPNQATAWPSPQIFAEYLNITQLRQRIEPIPGSNITTILLNGTTVENPVFDTRPGLQVAILFIRINSAIPSAIIGPSAIATYMNMTANLTKEIASNQMLLSRVQDFLATNFTVTPAPMPSELISGAVHGMEGARSLLISVGMAMAIACFLPTYF